MSKGCKVCNHKHVKEIDSAIVRGVTLQEIADKYSLHPSTVCRHKAHIADKITKANVILEAKEGAGVLQKISELLQKAHDLLDKAEMNGDIRTAIQAVREARGCLELMAKATGELAPEKLQIMIQPVVYSVVQILKAEIRDPETLQRIHERLININSEECC